MPKIDYDKIWTVAGQYMFHRDLLNRKPIEVAEAVLEQKLLGNKELAFLMVVAINTLVKEGSLL